MQKFKKILVSLCIVILLFNIVSPAMAANEAYDHKELLEYDGYGQAMYETVVEETTYFTGQYTENKEFVSKSIDQIVDYAKFWKNEAKDFIAEDSLRDAIERGGGYLLTVGDWVKKLFTGYEEKYYPPAVNDYSKYITVSNKCAAYPSFCNEFTVNTGYVLIIDNKHRLKSSDGVIDFHWLVSEDTGGSGSGRLRIKNGRVYDGKLVYFSVAVFNGIFKNTSSYQYIKGDFGKAVQVMNLFGVSAHFETDTGVVIKDEDPNGDFDKMKKYVDEKLDKLATPQPRPYLVCPNGTKVQMSISGSTFLGVDGKTMVVNKDGTAEVNSAICKLGWDKPPVKYIDDRAAIQTPDGKWQDVETGKTLDGDGDGEGEGECGMLCSLGKLTKFILDFFEKLLDFFIKIFVPENMDFVTVEFDKLKNSFDEKLGVIGDLKGTMEGFFAQENSNPLADLTISLPATGGQPLKVIETSLIEKHVPTVKKVMSGILVLTTVFYLYRKITGRGGVMEK